MEKERLRLMVKVCQLYYQDRLSQQEIADLYRISRPQVSRMISAAREEGIVEIKVRNPFNNETSIEKELISSFNLKDAIVVDTTDDDSISGNTSLARAGSVFFESVVRSGDIIGVMAGKTITAFINELSELQEKDLQVVPLVGGWGAKGAYWNANANVAQLAEKSNSDYFLLHAPAIVSSVETRSKLMEEPEIKRVLELSNQANIALVGIGEISENATFFKSMNMSQDELEEIKSEGTTGSLGTSFLNHTGQEVGLGYSERMIGITGNKLKEIPLVVGFARGESKIDAIYSSLGGNWLDVLVTDMVTAKQILNKHKSKED